MDGQNNCPIRYQIDSDRLRQTQIDHDFLPLGGPQVGAAGAGAAVGTRAASRGSHRGLRGTETQGMAMIGAAYATKCDKKVPKKLINWL